MHAFVREIRRLCKQLADLLGTTDRLVGAKGWEVATPQNVAFAGTSQTLDKPYQWFPNELFRFYGNEAYPQVLAFVSILLDDDRLGEYPVAVTQPLLTGGWFEFADEVPKLTGIHWWSRFHGYMIDRRDDGSLHRLEPKVSWREDPPHWYPFERVATFGIALAEISNAAALETHMIGPLLAHLREVYPARTSR